MNYKIENDITLKESDGTSDDREGSDPSGGKSDAGGISEKLGCRSGIR